MILERLLCCECSPGKVFKNNTTYKVHLKSKKHENWLSNNTIKTYKKTSVEYENNIFTYKLKLSKLEKEHEKLKIICNKKDQYIYYYLKNFILIIISLLIKYSNK